MYYTFSEQKANVVYRFNGTMKAITLQYFTEQNTERYIDVLPVLLDKYNNYFHRSDKIKLLEVDDGNEPQVLINLYEGRLFPRLESKDKNNLLIGDVVCVGIERGRFRKGTLEGWSEENFYIEHKISGIPVVYNLKDQAEEHIKGMFYNEELQNIIKHDAYFIENILHHKKGRQRNPLYLFKWK